MKKKISILALLLLAASTLTMAAHLANAQSGGVNYSVVPTQTLVNGKWVKLKSFSNGLKYYDLSVGTGPTPKQGQTVSVQYYGTTIDGHMFDATATRGNQPYLFPVGEGQVISGWDEGLLGSGKVPGIKLGGKRRLVIPGNLAYGPNSPTPAIPPNATLIFDIKLQGIQ